KLRLKAPVTVVAGAPLDLSKLVGAAPTSAVLAEITDFIMLTLRDMLAEIRGGTPPPLWSRPVERDLDAASRASTPGEHGEPAGERGLDAASRTGSED